MEVAAHQNDEPQRFCGQYDLVPVPLQPPDPSLIGPPLSEAPLAEMASEVVHELRNGLAGIGYQLELLQFELPNTATERVELIHRSIASVAGVLQRLQQMACPQSNSVMKIDLNQVLVDVAELTRFRWSRPPGDTRPRIAVHMDLQQVPAVRGNQGELVQVFVNLMMNACEALERGGNIRLSTRCSGPHVLAAVADDGPGMNDETRQAVFRRYFSTKHGDNCGLGLSIVADLVKRHGGHILLNSQPGKGSIFHVSLPKWEEARRLEQATCPRALRLLLVEDEPAARRGLSEFLTLAGHQVVLAENGEKAVAMLGDEYDVVLTDLTLGDLNGLEVAQATKARQQKTRVILLSGWHDTRDDKNVDLVLTKPLRGADVLTALERVMEDQKAA